MTHEHSFIQWATFHHAPIYPAPPAHTAFTVLVCDCGVYDVFPEANHAITTQGFQVLLRGVMLHCGYHPVGLIAEARELAAQGGTHDCGEWQTVARRCAVCDRSLAM